MTEPMLPEPIQREILTATGKCSCADCLTMPFPFPDVAAAILAYGQQCRNEGIGFTMDEVQALNGVIVLGRMAQFSGQPVSDLDVLRGLRDKIYALLTPSPTNGETT